MIRYLLEVSICWAGFYGLYYALLSRTTFFAANRWYLLGTLLLGLAVPLLELPVAAPAGQLPVVHYLQPLTVGVERLEVTVRAERSGGGFPLLAILTGIYWLGVMLSAARLLYGVGQIARLYRRSERRAQPGGYVLALTDEAHLPFTFFHVLFWSRRLPLADEDGQAVLRHEQAHIRGRHTLDVLLLEGLGIVFWCSPFVYLYRRSLRTVHEYLADQVVLRTTRRKTYGHLLLRQSQSGLQIALANHFIRSQLKKRILMMSRKNTHRAALVRYLLAAPLLVLFIVLFAGRELIGQTLLEIHRGDGTVQTHTIRDISEADKIVSPEEIESIDVFKEEGRIVIRMKSGGGRLQKRFLSFPLQVAIQHPDGRVEHHVLREEQQLGKIVEPRAIATMDITRSPDGAADNILIRLKDPAAPEKAEEGSLIRLQRRPAPAAEPLPRFPGCEEDALSPEEQQACSQTKMINFIARAIQYPAPARTSGIQGQVVVRFTVDETGVIRNPEVLKGIGGGCDEEALRVVQTMPRWIPAMKDGKAVAAELTLPVQFRLSPGGGPQAPENSDATVVFRVVEEMPRFPGCEDLAGGLAEKKACADRRMLEFIYSNIKYPGAARDAGVQGTAVVQFVVGVDGRITNAKMVREIGGGTSEEVLRIVQLMNDRDLRWTPGRQAGKAVPVQYNLPVKFALGDEPAENSLRLGAFRAAPNPAASRLQLRFEADPVPTTLVITDLSGREVFRRQITDFDGAFDQEIDLSHAPKGILLLSIRQGERVFTEKIVRQ